VLTVLADLVFGESLFQRVGAATGKEGDKNAVVADCGGWKSQFSLHCKLQLSEAWASSGAA